MRLSLDPDHALDRTELERLHRRLRTQLDRSGLEQVRVVRTAVLADGGRGAKELVLGVFDAVLPDAVKGAVPLLARSLGDFVRRSHRGVYVEIHGDRILIDRADPADVERLIDHFIAQTTTDGASPTGTERF
ncbi:MAG TPA: hypothetical protein VGN37_20605 [Actinocatenispora sp.]